MIHYLSWTLTYKLLCAMVRQTFSGLLVNELFQQLGQAKIFGVLASLGVLFRIVKTTSGSSFRRLPWKPSWLISEGLPCGQSTMYWFKLTYDAPILLSLIFNWTQNWEVLNFAVNLQPLIRPYLPRQVYSLIKRIKLWLCLQRSECQRTSGPHMRIFPDL